MTIQTRIKPFPLPAELPCENALKSQKQNSGAYEPWFWEGEYFLNRYLKQMPDKDLIVRYKDILFNIQRLPLADKTNLPINWPDSTWYWLRKEHQTRLEIWERKLISIETPITLQLKERSYLSIADKCEKAYRYMPEAYARQFMSGSIRVAPANDYGKIKDDAARNDIETCKTFFLPQDRITITDSGGKKMNLTSDVKVDHSGGDYHLLSTSTEWSSTMFSDFKGSTHCVVIHNIEEFASRLEESAKNTYDEWHFYHNPIFYFDPYEAYLGMHIDNAAHKSFKFAYQQEYRFLWGGVEKPEMNQPKFINIGNMDDIAELVSKPLEKH